MKKIPLSFDERRALIPKMLFGIHPVKQTEQFGFDRQKPRRFFIRNFVVGLEKFHGLIKAFPLRSPTISPGINLARFSISLIQNRLNFGLRTDCSVKTAL